MFWIITVSIVLKSFLRNFNHFINYKFFKINKIDITTGDFIFAILVIVIGQMILVGLKGFFRHQVNQKKIDLGTSHSIFRILKYLIWLILFGIILESAGFKLSLLLAGSAALLVGLGFGIQQLFSDFVSGLVIIAEGTVKVGDIVDVDGVVGKVIESDLRTTKILTPDSTTIILPNTQLTANKLINNTNTDTKTRFRVAVGVAYGSDIELVERLLKECASEHKNILTEPAPSVIFKDFGESSLDFELLFWSNDEFVIQLVKSDLRKAIYHKFNQNKIVIPFPQRDVYIYNK
jgi:small-conductance mechanosensitive channel